MVVARSQMGEIAIFGGRRVLEAKRRAEGEGNVNGTAPVASRAWRRRSGCAKNRGGESTDAGRDGGVVVVNLSQFLYGRVSQILPLRLGVFAIGLPVIFSGVFFKDGAKPFEEPCSGQPISYIRAIRL